MLFLFILFEDAPSFGQREITVGDSCPDFEMKHILNYTKPNAKISDFRGKVLLLDFWATWCSPCVASFPKIEALQKEYEGKVQILPVTFQDAKTVASFFDNMKKVQQASPPPSVVDDSVLNDHFKPAYIPHYVWIDKEGIIRAITGASEVTAENIQTLVNGQTLTLAIKKDSKKDIDPMQPVFSGEQQISIGDSDVICHSLVTKYNDALFSFITVTDNRITAVNQSIKQLFTLAYGEFKPEYITDSKVVLEIKDTGSIYKYTFGWSNDNNKFNEWKWQNLYNYELIVPPGMQKDKFKIMRQDLERNFDLNAKIEKKNAKCFVLMRTSNENKLKSVSTSQVFERNKFYLHITRQPIKAFLAALVLDMQTSLPLVDETNYTGDVDIELNADLSDINQVNKALKKYDLRFTETERAIDFIIITQKEKNE